MMVVTALNFVLLKIKWEHQRYTDLFFDVSLLVALSWLFKGTITGLTVAMGASFIISVYLFFWPPKFDLGFD